MRSYTRSYGAEFIRLYMDPQNTRVEAIYEVTHTQVQYINQKRDPCNEKHDDEFNNCMDSFIPSRMNCTLPWDVTNSSSKLASPLCSNDADYHNFR